jgi:hypothetical protein
MTDRSSENVSVWRLAQAIEVVSVQVDCSLDHALDLITDRGIITGHTPLEIAASVVDGSIRFDR